ncbi:hypothetical protein KFK09_014903 [Dendrobium nobile]|uniref:Splicing factor Cactin n=1 Tax=Dendrobium nobile TaxID=94219 RepID=A0A8T3B955_DENNO|nr:hypothetical protein KFK09_014903 [Dendrobium nobile]
MNHRHGRHRSELYAKSQRDYSSGRSDLKNSRRGHGRRGRVDSSQSDTGSDFGSDDHHKKGKKSREITEEEIVDYMAKKAQKKAIKVAKKLKSQVVSGYSNDSNPFGDSNLTENFVWRKKIERDISQGVIVDISVSSEKKRQRERMAEIEKVKKRREERAVEKAQHEEEMAMLARERAKAEFQDWEKKEEEFHFDQSKFRSMIRLREGRVKPIDILAKNLDCSDDFDIEINEPYTVFKGLTVREMEELWDDIKMYLDMDRSTETRIRFWEALMVVCNWELAEARKRDALDRARVRGEEPPADILAEERGLHSSIESDVKGLLEGKSFVELEKMQENIELQMRSGTAKVVEYWEAVIKRLQIYKAKACLREIHANLLRKHLLHLEQPVKVERGLENSEAMKPIEVDNLQVVEDHQQAFVEIEMDESENEPEGETGSFSPELLQCDEDEEAIDPEEDQAELVYWWHDKYRPRKPKYFNRVHTGYEWNKYNQTHYDHDNPPPKIVQGYKFNIFYPDLVDKSKAPIYTIEKDGISNETCIIRFHAGPPYEDIAFRIVNKEWEYSHKKGFKCTFERGILHVYFNFKRYRYRR